MVRRVLGQPTVPLTDSTFHRRRAKGQVGRENFVSHEWRQTRSSSRMVAGSAQLGLCKTENLPKGRDSATATKSSSKEIGKQFKMATKIFGTFMDRLDSLKVNMIMEVWVIR